MNSIQKGLRQLLSPVGRPTAEAVKASAIAILASFPTPPQNQSIFYGSQHSLGEVFCYFYKSNDLCFLTGSKRKRPCRGQRESPLFSSSTKKFTPCNQNGRLSAKKRPVVGATCTHRLYCQIFKLIIACYLFKSDFLFLVPQRVQFFGKIL